MKKFICLFWICIITLISFSSCQVDFQSICQAGIRQDNTNYIHCARKQLNAIPNFSRITNTFYDELVLNDNQIDEIHLNSFQGLRVKRLNLSGNRIRRIDPRAFRELANYLEELTIEFDSNVLVEIPDAIKFNLINLRSLKLINLNLTTLRNETFVKYRKLEELSIIKSNVKIIEKSAFRSLNQLRSLHLDQNQLSEQIWSDLSEDFVNLETLTLSQNNIQSLKGNFLLTQVKLLDLSSNGLQSIEKNFFENLTRLEKLALQNNELNSLHLAFLHLLPNLKELNLDFNRLTFIPENLFMSNRKLVYLSLQGNDLNSLTNKSFRGLNQLTYLNLARNRLQFLSFQQPFQYLNSLEILNLDRNTQMNLSKITFQGLEENLIELSLQNCNLSLFTSMNNPFESFVHLQRLKLSSNFLNSLPENFLEKSISSLISIDLQRNRFRTIPTLFGRIVNNSKLTDFDLSSNQICTLNRHDLYQYSNLKTIGLTGNPLHCNCHLRWLKQWLIKNYDYDLIKFLQWTCSTPLILAGKQLTMIDEQEMICDGDDLSQCQSERRTTIKSSTRTQLNMISSTTTTTTSSSTTLMMSTSASTIDELVINDLSYNQNGMLTITWDSLALIIPKYYHLQIYDEQRTNVLLQRLIDGDQRAIEIDIKDTLKDLSSNYVVCLNVRQKKFCRNLYLQSNPIATSVVLSSTSQETHSPSLQMVYLLSGICLGALFVSLVLTIVCCWRIRYLSRIQHSKSLEKVNTSSPFYPNSSTGAHSSIFYRPLNIISYPQHHHQQQQQAASCDTSECSLHSSTDTSQLASDTYHIYQQIPSVYNCHLHPTRTHILV